MALPLCALTGHVHTKKRKQDRAHGLGLATAQHPTLPQPAHACQAPLLCVPKTWDSLLTCSAADASMRMAWAAACWLASSDLTLCSS